MAIIDQTERRPEIRMNIGNHQVSIIDYTDGGFGLKIHTDKDHKFMVRPDGAVISIKEKYVERNDEDKNDFISALSTTDEKGKAIMRLDNLRLAAGILLDFVESYTDKDEEAEDFCIKIMDQCDKLYTKILRKRN